MENWTECYLSCSQLPWAVSAGIFWGVRPGTPAQHGSGTKLFLFCSDRFARWNWGQLRGQGLLEVHRWGHRCSDRTLEPFLLICWGHKVLSEQGVLLLPVGYFHKWIGRAREILVVETGTKSILVDYLEGVDWAAHWQEEVDVVAWNWMILTVWIDDIYQSCFQINIVKTKKSLFLCCSQLFSV